MRKIMNFKMSLKHNKIRKMLKDFRTSKALKGGNLLGDQLTQVLLWHLPSQKQGQ